MAGGVSVFAITLFLVDKYSFQVDQSLSSLLRSFASRAALLCSSVFTEITECSAKITRLMESLFEATFLFP